MVFKNKRDQEFFLALRAAGLTRNKAFHATVKSRKHRDKGIPDRWAGGVLWGDVGVDNDAGLEVVLHLNGIDPTKSAAAS